MLVLARVGALMMTAPIFGTRAAPMQVRALLAVAMSLLVTPLLQRRTRRPTSRNLLAFGKFVLNEALLGLLLGLGVMILFSRRAGHRADRQPAERHGAGRRRSTRDFEENVPVFSQLFYFLTLAMFVLLDGHRLLIEALLDTYVWLPPGKAVLGDSFVDGADDAAGPELSARHSRRGAGDDGAAAGDARAGPDRPHAAADQHPGRRLQPELAADARRACSSRSAPSPGRFRSKRSTRSTCCATRFAKRRRGKSVVRDP